MSSIAGAERNGRVLGRDFDVVAKEAIAVLRRFRREAIIIKEDVGRAGEFLARALVAEIEKRPPEARQGLEVPAQVDWGDTARLGG
jgi:LacI family transcriptional regulator